MKRVLTPGRALRRPKVRAILLFLVAREDTAKSVREACRVSSQYSYESLHNLVSIGFVERLVEEGTVPAYRTSEKGVEALVRKGLLSPAVQAGGVKVAMTAEGVLHG